MIGKTISHYKIIEKLGEGGMGVVFKAEDTRLKRLVALKFLPSSSFMASEAEKTRFVHEAQAAAALNHPNICTIYEIDEVDGQSFIAMEFVEGQSLKVQIDSGPLKVDETLDIATQIAQGLAKAHEHGIVHRDIKPANVLIAKDGVVKIVDFGLAKLASQPRLTKTGSTMGTMAYMSPEQARGEAVDHRTDIWALGVVIYEMLTGQLPFKGEQEHAMMYAVLNATPKPLQELRADVPLALEQIVDKALAKSAAKRYQSMNDMLDALKTLKQKIELGNAKARLLLAKLRRKKRIVQYAAVAVLLVAFTGIGLYLNQRLQQEPKIHSIAVLPLANLSGDANQEFFADGMTEALISVLGQIQALRVISRTSVMQYKTAPKPLPVIAQELNVDAVVEGSVEPAGNHVGIAVRLIEAKTEKRLWSKSFERELREVIILQREIALAITREIEVRVTGQEQALLQEARAVDPEAYKLYLWGLKFREREYPEDYRHAVNQFEQAIKVDPDFVQAYAALVGSYYMLGGFGLMSKKEAESKARQAAAKALELDGNLSEAHAAMADIRMLYDWNWSGAEKELRHAIKLNPGNSEAHRGYGLLLINIGRTQEGVTEMIRALDLDPLSNSVNGDLARAYIFDRQYDKAMEHCLKLLQLNPDFSLVQYYLGQTYLIKGLYEKAIAVFETKEMGAFDFMDVKAYLGIAYASSGKRERALKLLEELKERLKRGEDTSVFISLIYVGLGEKGKALTMLELGSEQRQWFMMSPFLDPLRAEPRFQALLKRMGLQNDRSDDFAL